MCSGHASRQMGLDVDLWLIPAPHPGLSAAEREELSAVSMLRPGVREVDPARFGPGQAAPIHRAAQSPQVERVFIHPTLKQALCAGVGGDRAWLAKVRPRWGRDEPFHVQLACPPDQPDCHAHKAPPPGDGCGAELAWWLSDEPWKPEAIGPSKPLRMADMPSACQAVLVAP